MTPNAEALNRSGIRFLSEGKAREAEAAFRELLLLQPNSAPVYANLGMALRLQNRGSEALEAFQRAVTLDPAHPGNYLQLFKQFQQLGSWKEAIETLRAGRELHPNSMPLAEALALAYGRVGQSDRAEALFQEISQSDPDAANSYASWLHDEGRFDESVPALEHSLRLKPIQGVAYRQLTEAHRFTVAGSPLLTKALAVATEPSLNEKERMHLAYAISRAFDHQREFKQAMSWLDEANAIAYRTYPACQTFDPVWTAREPEAMANLYTSELLSQHFGGSGVRPIFIVGMIRSGTTLLDQILSSHPDVNSVGEPQYWTAQGDAIHARWSQRPPTEAEIAKIREGYLAAIQSSSSARFSDKMPLNYRHLGPILLAFPEAQILHLRRDPFDTCLSIYTTFFAGGPNFAYSQENIATFYRAYLRHMEHWRSVIPGDQLLELDYEDLVADPEPVIRRVLNFLELPWDDACLRHQENRAQVTTPSRWQARQPVYTTSVGKREVYGPFVGELFLSLPKNA